MAWHIPFLRHSPKACPAPVDTADPIGDHLRAVVNAHAQAKANHIRSYETRVQGMIEDLFFRMDERHARHNP
jgi:hypothetical protein